LELPIHLTVSTYDDFEDKLEILKIFKRAEEEHINLQKDVGWKSKSLLTIKYMIEYHHNRDDPFDTLATHGEESRYFHTVYIEHLARLPFDDLPSWTDE
jgi:hypothetical protein